MTLNDLCKMKGLTRTQTLVVKQLVGSGSVKSISTTLHKSQSAVKYHIWKIYKIFNVDSRYEFINAVSMLLNKFSNPDYDKMQMVVNDLAKRVEQLEQQLKVSGPTVLPIGRQINT